MNRHQQKKNSLNKELRRVGSQPILKLTDYSAYLTNPQQKRCKIINKDHLCFCGHTYQTHRYHHQSRALLCGTIACTCKSFQYIPHSHVNCLCMHPLSSHRGQAKKCVQCRNCVGFSADIYCKCGYRFMQHRNVVQLKAKNGKQNREEKFVKLPNIIQSPYDQLPKEEIDEVVETECNVHAPQHPGLEDKDEDYTEQYLKQKLKQANKRYFFNFSPQQPKPKQELSYSQPSAYGLYLQPHFYKTISLTKMNLSLAD